jgi:hypothetical protein
MTEFRIADTFTDSLARLTGDEQKSVKTTAFDLQMDPGPVSVRRSLVMAGRFQHVDTRFGCTQVPAFRTLMAAM